MNDSLWTFGFEIANFVTLAVFLGWFLFKPVREAIELEQNKILQLEQAAQDKLAEADRTNQEIATKYKDLDAELEKIRASSREAANQERERLLAEVHAEVATERDQLKQQAKQSQQIQAAHLAQSVVESTCILTDRLLHQIDGPELEQALIDAALREWKVLPTGLRCDYLAM